MSIYRAITGYAWFCSTFFLLVMVTQEHCADNAKLSVNCVHFPWMIPWSGLNATYVGPDGNHSLSFMRCIHCCFTPFTPTRKNDTNEMSTFAASYEDSFPPLINNLGTWNMKLGTWKKQRNWLAYDLYEILKAKKRIFLQVATSALWYHVQPTKIC